MQASVSWTPPSGALGTLLEVARTRVESLAGKASELRAMAADAPPRVSFEQALRRSEAVGVIAEIKRQSPSKGSIRPEIDAGSQAAAYARGGASAISVLTEESHFGGHVLDLEKSALCGLPLLRKDFIISELQIDEARVYGASAVLLILRALPPDAIAELHAYAHSRGLDTLVEAHSPAELEIAIDAGYPIVGVNNRSLETLHIDPDVARTLIPAIPPSTLAVYESGISARDGVVAAARLGADAVLVGSAVSASDDPEGAVRGLAGVPREGRHAS